MSEFLPKDLAIEILARLSMKDLSRFKCVCKTWKNLINHRQFAQKFRDVSPAKFVSFHDNCFYLLDVEGNNSVLPKSLNKLEFPLDQSMIDGSTCVLHCDGTLCLTLKNNTLMVWNPSLKQFKILPNPGIYQDSNILGFGYDPLHDEYKVVTFVDRLDSSTAQVFEFRSDSWQESVQIPLPNWHYRERRGTFLDHFLYWIAFVSHVDRFVLCFNLSTHKYRKFPLPVYNQGMITSSWLGVKSQQLCITEYEPCEKQIQISVMEKTGSWSKIISVLMSSQISVQDRICDYQLDFVSFTKKNDLVVIFTEYHDDYETESKERAEKMFLYKTGAETFEQVRFCNTLSGIRFLSELVETPVIINCIFI